MENEVENEPKIQAIIFNDGSGLQIGKPINTGADHRVARFDFDHAWMWVFAKRVDGDKEWLAYKMNPQRINVVVYEVPDSKPIITLVK